MDEADWPSTAWTALADAARRQHAAWEQVRVAYERGGPTGAGFYAAVAQWGAACGAAADLAETVADLGGAPS
jgi:hypothetical protein